MSVLLATAEAATEPAVWSDAWWSAFTRSAGFGGVAALLAAVVALFSAGRRNSTDRKLATAVRRGQIEDAEDARKAQVADSAADRWWSMYQWTLDAASDMEPSRVLMLLKTLDGQAPTKAEKALVSVAIDIFVGEEAS